MSSHPVHFASPSHLFSSMIPFFLLWGVDSYASESRGGSAYLLFRLGLVGFLVLAKKCGWEGALGNTPPATVTFFSTSYYDGIISYICQWVYLYKVFLHPFSCDTTTIHLYCCLPVLQLRTLRPREVAQGHIVSEWGFLPKNSIKSCSPDLYLFLAISFLLTWAWPGIHRRMN